MGRKPWPILLRTPCVGVVLRARGGRLEVLLVGGELPAARARGAASRSRRRSRARSTSRRSRTSSSSRRASLADGDARDRVSRARRARTTALDGEWRAGRHRAASTTTRRSSRAAQARLRAKLSYTNVGFALAPETFTISELREIYVAALGHDVSATNLQRVLVRRGVLERVDGRRAPGRAGGRPAALFRFASQPARGDGRVRGAQAAALTSVARMSRQRLKRSWCVSVDEAQLAFGSAPLEVAADRRRAHGVALAPPERHRRAHVGELEAPRAAEVRELAREPQAAVAERLDAAARVRLVGQRVAGRRRRPPPPRARARARRPAARRARAASPLARRAAARATRSGGGIDADERDARHALRRDRGERERVRAARRPADDAEPLDVERADGRLRPRAQRRAAHAPARSGRPRAAARRATRRSSRRDAARAASRRRRAGRRPAPRPGRRRRRRSARDDQRRAHAERCDGSRRSTRTSIAPARASPSAPRARPAATTPSPAMCRAPTRCTRRSCASWPKFASSITAVPGLSVVRESENENSCATTCTRAGAASRRCAEQRRPSSRGQDASFT